MCFIKENIIVASNVLMITTLLASAAPVTFHWSPKCAVIMILCNVLTYAIARANIAKPNEGFEIPNSKFYGGLSHASVVGANCLGHIFGIGAILGLASRGVL